MNVFSMEFQEKRSSNPVRPRPYPEGLPEKHCGKFGSTRYSGESRFIRRTFDLQHNRDVIKPKNSKQHTTAPNRSKWYILTSS